MVRFYLFIYSFSVLISLDRYVSRSIIINHHHHHHHHYHYHKNDNFLDCDWFKNLLFSSNSLAKLMSDSLLLDSLLSDSSISQSHSKLYFKSTNHIQSCNYVRACVHALTCDHASLQFFFSVAGRNA